MILKLISLKQKLKPKAHNGFTLIELLVSLFLSSMLIALAFNLYYTTKRSEQLSTAVIDTQTQSRNALHFVRQAIEQAGYTPATLNNAVQAASFPADANFATGQVLRIVGTGVQQRLRVRLLGDSNYPLRGCNGEVLSATTPTTLEFFIVNGALLCQVYFGGTLANTPVTIIDDVAAFQFRATLNTGLSNARVVNSIGINTPGKVRGVQVQLVVRSKNPIRNNNKMTQVDSPGFNGLMFNDKYYYFDNTQFFLAQN